LLGLIPLTFVALWLQAEIKSRTRSVRIITGCIAGVSFSFWLLSLSNSLGSYYDGMREHRLLQSLINAHPGQRRQIEAWAADYKFYGGFDNHVQKRDTLERMITTDR
jgi:hypothetical protein